MRAERPLLAPPCPLPLAMAKTRQMPREIVHEPLLTINVREVIYTDRRSTLWNPVIRNFRSIHTPEGPAARLISLDDDPPTCTMSYSEIYPDKTSTHHTHPWEHEVYIIKGSGTLVCDGKEYPVREGDAMFIPGDVDHYTLNNGGQGVMRRIEINPLIAAQSGGPGAVRSTPRQRARRCAGHPQLSGLERGNRQPDSQHQGRRAQLCDALQR